MIVTLLNSLQVFREILAALLTGLVLFHHATTSVETELPGQPQILIVIDWAGTWSFRGMERRATQSLKFLHKTDSFVPGLVS